MTTPTDTTPPQSEVQPPPRKRHRVRRVLLILGGALTALILLIVIISLATAKPNTIKPVAAPSTSAPPAATSAPATSAPATPATSAPATSAPATSAPATSAPATTAPAMTVAEQQAVSAAQGYLSLGTGFSEQGLFQQLTSADGSGFSASDANFAITYLHPDWDAQAVLAAKSYLSLGTGFSASSLLQQLTSADGSGFTYSQAEYALQQVGM